MSKESNPLLILIVGHSGCGKSYSLKGIENQERWRYANCESGKMLPFQNNFKSVTITDPKTIHAGISGIHNHADYDGIVVDSLSFLMEMYESQYVVPLAGTQKGQTAWGEYAQFYKTMMQQHVAPLDKTVIFTSHLTEINDENTGDRVCQALVKGSLKHLSMESFFSCVIAAKKMRVTQIEKEFAAMGIEPDANGNYSDLLNITAKERRLDRKYVFQTDVTAKTLHERLRSPDLLFEENELFIDNNCQHLINRLNKFYNK